MLAIKGEFPRKVLGASQGLENIWCENDN